MYDKSTQGLNIENTNALASSISWRYFHVLQALNLLHIMVLEVDRNGHVVYANRTAKEILGDIEHISSERDGNNFLLMDFIEKFNKRDVTLPILNEIYEENSNTWYRITSDSFLLPNGQELYIHMIEDVSEWKTNENQLRLSATMDAMTGTYNREVGVEELNKILISTDQYKTCCIAFIDIDGLKTINDNYGHSEGDYAIKGIAEVILSSVRDTDMVCRYGGDEFFIIFKNCDEEVVEKIITRMFKKLKKLDQKKLKPFSLSFSYGIASFYGCDNSERKATDLLKKADQKMYIYKTKKRRKINDNTQVTCDG